MLSFTNSLPNLLHLYIAAATCTFCTDSWSLKRVVDDICKNVLLLDILCVTLNLLHLEQFRDHNESLSVTDKGKAIVVQPTTLSLPLF